jgi:hypothetical protein
MLLIGRLSVPDRTVQEQQVHPILASEMLDVIKIYSCLCHLFNYVCDNYL